MKKQFKFYDLDKKLFEKIRNDIRFANFTDLQLQILFNRGLKTPDEVNLFLFGTLKDLSDPKLMKDSDKFCNTIQNALIQNLGITFYTDFDTDGTCAGGIGVLGLNKVAKEIHSTSEVNWYANSRFKEGYGITPNGVDDLMKKFPNTKVIITTDNGIVGYKGVERAKELGLIVIVTDHHQEGETPTIADAIIDPHQKDCNSTFKHLCGAGVIFQLILLLAEYLDLNKEDYYEFVDICALATVSDMVPLIGDNRIIVKEGLKRINNEIRPMFKNLKFINNMFAKKASQRIKFVDEDVLGFNYGPSFNSDGRMNGTINIVMSVLLETDETKQKQAIKKLFELNQERKDLTDRKEKEAITKLTRLYPNEENIPNFIVYKDDEISEGIIGLVANRIKDYFYRPTVVYTTAKKKILVNGKNKTLEILKGSARSIESFDIRNSFENVSDNLIYFGGHPAAAGLGCFPEQLSDFTTAINKYSDNILTEDLLMHKIYVDYECSYTEITDEFINSLNALRPYGVGFHLPRIQISDMMIDLSKHENNIYKCICGDNRETLRFINKDNFTCIAFKHVEMFKSLKDSVQNNVPIKAIGYPAINEFRGTKSYQLRIEEDYLI